MLVIDSNQAIAIATILIAGGGALVAYFNAQTNRLSFMLDTLKAINNAQAGEIISLRSEITILKSAAVATTHRMDALQADNVRLLAQLVAQLSQSDRNTMRLNTLEENRGGESK